MGSARFRIAQRLVLAGLLAIVVGTGFESVVFAQTTPGSSLITVSVESSGAVDTATIESSVRPIIDTALSELSSLFAYQPRLPLAITFGSAPDLATQKRWQSVDDLAWVDPAAQSAIVDLGLYAQQSPVEAANVIRNLDRGLLEARRW